MADLRESMDGFLGGSTVQVLDSSPSGQDETVEGLMVPEGEVTFQQESQDLVGNNLTLMEGDVLVSEETGAILVQNGMYIGPEQMARQSEQIIAYIPESVPDQGHSLIVEESDAGIRHIEDPSNVEEGIYETDVAVHGEAMVAAPQVEDQRIEEVATMASASILAGMQSAGFQVHPDDGDAMYVEVESDQILMQEVPEQSVAEMQQMDMEVPAPPGDEQPEEGGPQEEQAMTYAEVVAMEQLEETVAETSYHDAIQPGDLIYESEEQRAQDQELQVVPDSNEAEANKNFLSENLHESMDGGVVERASSMGIQLVPTSSTENSQDTMALHREDILLQETIYATQEEAIQQEAESRGEEGDAMWQGEQQSILETQPDLTGIEQCGNMIILQQDQLGEDFTETENCAILTLEDPATMSAEQSDFGENEPRDAEAELENLIPPETTSQTVADVDESTIVQAATEDVAQSITHVLDERDMSSAEEPTDKSDEQSYEVCVTLPELQGEESGSRTITVPINIGGQVQQIPIQLPDWADLTQQSLVAVTEDGTQIPLTFIEADDDEPDDDKKECVEVQLDSELLSAPQLTDEGEELIAVQEGDSDLILAQEGESGIILAQEGESGILLTQDGENQYEVINMLDSQEYQFQDGVLSIVAKENSTSSQQRTSHRSVKMNRHVTPAHATSMTPLYFDGSGLAVPERSILPDSSDEVTNVIHIPEDAYLSGHPIEVQVVEIPGGRIVQKTHASGRGAQRRRRPYRRAAPRQQRAAVTPSESQRAVRSIDKANVAAPPRPQSRQRALKPAVQEERATAEEAANIKLSNTTPSVISPENMQALIQVLQSLPTTSRGQTIQIVLQSDQPLPQGMEETSTVDKSSETPEELARRILASSSSHVPAPSTSKEQYIQVVQMSSSQFAQKSTSDIAIQVSPEFIKSTCENGVPDASENSQHGTTITVLTEDLLPTVQQSVDGDDSFLYANEPKKRKAGKKKASRIVTVEEQYVVDPQPGVSYYAVIDYMSEHEQDGMSSASEMKRPEALFSGFMEDHLELQCVAEEAKGRSMLESTVTSSVIMSTPLRRKYRASSQSGDKPSDPMTIDLPPVVDDSSVTLRERTYDQAKLEDEIVSMQPIAEVRHRKRARHRAPRPAEQDVHKCGYCEFGSTDKILVVEHCISEHSALPVKTLSLLPQMTGRMCPYCQQSFDHTEFFSHMRFAHSEVHPYKCGYCDFMGRDRNQIRHHIQKKHRLPMKVINMLNTNRRHEDAEHLRGRKRIMALSEGEDTVYEYLTDEEEMEGDNDSDNGNSRRGLICPECKKSFKTLKYLKTHIKIHQPLRYQCGYCDFISVMLHQVIRHCQKKHDGVPPKVLTKELEPEKHPVVSRDMDNVLEKVFSLNTRLPRDPDAAKWMRKWFCPHCDYTCQFGASYRRHLRMHANILPYKCNYCSFKGREKYYVRRHIDRMHKDLPIIVVENTPENCARDTSSDEDFQEKGLRRKRRRRTKDAEHAVVPLGHLEDELFGQQFQKLPVGDRGIRRARLGGEELENEFPLDSLLPFGVDSYKSRTWPRTKQWSEENLEDYILEQDGDTIVCKICGARTQEKAFFKHARKHFKQRPYKCCYCNYMSIDRSKMHAHNSQKHPNAPFKVEECHLASITPEDFLDLIGGDDLPANVQVADPLSAQFACPLCQATVSYDEKSLQDHFYAHYDYYPFKCSECDFQATCEEKVVEHGASHQSDIIVYQIELDKPDGLDEIIAQFLKEGDEIAQQRISELLEQGGATYVTRDDKEPEGNAAAGHLVSLFQCPLCDQQMVLHAVSVRRHLYVHYDYKPFRCGICDFAGFTKGTIKQHTAAAHRLTKAKIELSNEPMPDDLAKILRHIHSVLKLTPEEMESAEVEMLVPTKDRANPLTAEGRRWKETLATGLCPWCSAKVGASKLHAHLLTHFSTEPFQCGYCEARFQTTSDADQHVADSHPNEEPKILEVIEDEAVVRKGLSDFMKSKRATVGAHSVIKDTSADPEAPAGAAQEAVTTIEGEMKKLMDDGKQFQYQVVIMNEDGTVMETMEVMAERPLMESELENAELLKEAPPLRDVTTPTPDANADGPETERETGSGENPESQKNEAGNAETEEKSLPKAEAEDSLGKIVENLLERPEKVGESKDPDTEDKRMEKEAEPEKAESLGMAEAEDNLEKIVENLFEEKGSETKEPIPEKEIADADKQVEADDFSADIVTVDKVLLTRSFRSDTEYSGGEGDDVMGGSPCPSNATVNSDEDDDNDELLAIGPSLDFMSDILSLLKQSSEAITHRNKPIKVESVASEQSRQTSPKIAALQEDAETAHPVGASQGTGNNQGAEDVPKHEEAVHPEASGHVPMETEESAEVESEAILEPSTAVQESELAVQQTESLAIDPEGNLVTTLTSTSDEKYSTSNQQALPPAEELPETEEETIENITRMIQGGLEETPQVVPSETEQSNPVPPTSTEVPPTVCSASLEPDKPVRTSAPSRLEASKRESLQVLKSGAEEDPVPMPSESGTSPPVTSKPSRLEAYKLEAQKKVQDLAKKGDEASTSVRPQKKVTRMTSRTESSNTIVGKYKLRGRGQPEEQPRRPVGRPKKRPKDSGKKVDEVKAEEAGTSGTRKVRKVSKAEEGKEEVPAEESGEVTLEGLENLEECDENLPKILQILQLRPTKENDKS